MPKVPSLDDRASKSGVISSHRWLGANTATPLFYGQTEQVEATEQFLKSNVLSVDIFSIIKESTSEQLAPLGREESLQLKPGEEITVEVVVANRNAAHSFPPELGDLYEAWVEFEAIDRSGKTIFHSGFLRADKTLDEGAHVYRTVFLDEQGRMITRHQMWLVMMKAYDNAIGPGRSDLVRLPVRVASAIRLAGTSATTDDGVTSMFHGDRLHKMRVRQNSAALQWETAVQIRVRQAIFSNNVFLTTTLYRPPKPFIQESQS